MKKNNYGFTMVELLAAIVILGILSTLAIPAIMGVVHRGKNKIYVSDALKLISIAEMEIRMKSDYIKKPDDGKCIVLSMHYLNPSELDSPPNGGKYMEYYSYVVVKNNGGELEYSAFLVEKLPNNHYMGVKLSKKSSLLASNAVDNVVESISGTSLFTVSDVLSVRNKLLTNINTNLGSGYVTSVTKAYY